MLHSVSKLIGNAVRNVARILGYEIHADSLASDESDYLFYLVDESL